MLDEPLKSMMFLFKYTLQTVQQTVFVAFSDRYKKLQWTTSSCLPICKYSPTDLGNDGTEKAKKSKWFSYFTKYSTCFDDNLVKNGQEFISEMSTGWKVFHFPIETVRTISFYSGSGI